MDICSSEFVLKSALKSVANKSTILSSEFVLKSALKSVAPYSMGVDGYMFQ